MGGAQDKLSLQGAWAMAVGGMVGGGIFSALGVVVSVAGGLAWLSFLVAGVIALITGVNYARLARAFGEGGGAFTFLRECHRARAAGSLSWVLLAGYILTIAVYAFTFGHYAAHVFGLGPGVSRAAAVGVVVLFVWLNLRSVGQAAWVEIGAVWLKVAILLGLAGLGLWLGDPSNLGASPSGASSNGPAGVFAALFGAGAVFMAYEGFQLLAYDYEDIGDPDRTLPRAIVLAIACVIAIYIVVSIGALMLVGASDLIAHKEVALANAGEAALGAWGLVIVSIGAALSASSAINATIFATARLAKRVASDGELPGFLAAENDAGVPARAVLIVGGLGAALGGVGGLGSLVEAASLAFLVTFAIVNLLAALDLPRLRWLGWIGAALATAGAGALALRLMRHDPWVLIGGGVVAAAAFVLRPLLVAMRRHEA